MKRLFGFSKRRSVAAVAVTGLLMVPLAIVGGPALANTASALHQYGKPTAAQYQYRVRVCHHTGSKHHPWHEITVSNRAVAAHLRHGDQLAPCTTAETKRRGDHHGKPGPASPQGNAVQSAKHDEDDDHGKGKGKGHNGRS